MLGTFLKKNSTSISLLKSLEHPIDSSLILRKKHALKKELLETSQLIVKKIALLGGSTTAEIKAILELFLLHLGIKAEFYESEFNCYYEEAVFENSALLRFKPDVIYIHISNKNIQVYPLISDSEEEINHKITQEQNKYKRIWSALAFYNCPIIQNNFEYPQHRILGNLDAYDPRGALHFINRLNAFFASQAMTQANLFVQDINYLAASLGLNQWFDKQLWYSAKYALSFEAIPHLAKNLAALIASLFGMSKKVIALDLDNTCWGGIIGDDGLAGIAIGKETPLAEAYTDFQAYIKALKERGIVLVACSKNEAEQARLGFTHPDMVLTEDDFAALEINWEPKDKNLLGLSKQLDLGLDSFIFIDDNPAERHLIRDNLSMVAVPDIGSDVLYFIDYIDKNYYFEPVFVSAEDIKRSALYQKKSQAAKTIDHYADYGAYLNSLAMKAEILPFAPLYLERITQLIHKTHQFNLTNKSYALNEIELIAQDPVYISLYGRLEDCYGEHGLISVLLGRIDKTKCYIDLWLMSCRVLKRTMEHAMLDILVERCQALGIETLIGYYCPSDKNKLVAHLYEEFGFRSQVTANNSIVQWALEIKQYINKNHHIKVNT